MTKKRSTRLKASAVDILIFALCSIGAAFSLGLYYKDINSFSLKNNETPVAKIYFRRNTVQRKFIDNDIWERMANHGPVYNGDKIRTAGDSEASAEFEGTGVQVELNENSLIQIFNNKKEKAIDFLSGELLISSYGSGEGAVVKTGKKKISASANSKVKISISKEAKQEAVVQVVEGTATISAASAPAILPIFQKQEKAEEVLSAGQETVVDMTGEKEARQEAVLAASEKIEDAAEKPAAAKKEKPKKEKVSKAKDAKKEKAASAGKAEPVLAAPATEAVPASEAAPAVAEEESASAPKTRNPNEAEKIEAGAMGKYEAPYWTFNTNVYNKETREYNYQTRLAMRQIFGVKKFIPQGSVLEFKISGRPDENLSAFGMNISSGRSEQINASPYCFVAPNNGKGFLKDAAFSETVRVFVEEEIESTNYANLLFSYEKDALDKQTTIYDFKVEAKVVALDANDVLTPVEVGRKAQSAKIERVSLGFDKKSRDYSLYLSPGRVLGRTKSLPKGAKIKISFNGASTLALSSVNFNLSNCSSNGWESVAQGNLDDGSGSVSQEFNLEKVFTLEKDLKNSDAAIFQINLKSAKRERVCELTNANIIFERVE